MKERLRQLRGKRSQRQVEIQTGVKQRTVSRWESDPPEYLDSLAVLAKYYHVSADYLLGLTNDPTPSDSDASPHFAPLTDEERALLEEFRALPDEAKETLLGFLQSFAQRPSVRIIGEEE